MANNPRKEARKSSQEALQRRLDKLLSYKYEFWHALEEMNTFGGETYYDSIWAQFKLLASGAPHGGSRPIGVMIDKLERIIDRKSKEFQKRMEEHRLEVEQARAANALEAANYVHKPKHPIKRLK